MLASMILYSSFRSTGAHVNTKQFGVIRAAMTISPFPSSTLALVSRPAKQGCAPMAEIKDPENTVIITLKDGEVVVALLPDVAPKHVERMKALARAKAYDNVCFHRVIEGFMAQTGDVANGDMEDAFNLRRAGTGGSDLPDLPAEFSKLPHDRGSIGAARSSAPNSANSQFFINFSDNSFLNGQYTVYGRVISGMEHVDKIARGEPPASPDRMITVRVAADVA
jgi:cyclophilin family peptidyl-prolyl cis-trans isomerase